MNIKKILGLFFTILNLCKATIHHSQNIEHCLTQRDKDKKEIQFFFHGKPIDIHIDGQPIQPMINAIINITLIEKC